MKDTRGITLIALIITIIVLLILAGVSISTIVGENGVVSQAVKGKENTEMAAIKEDVEIMKGEGYIYEFTQQDTELTQQKLLNKINLEYEGSYYVGNKIITADKQYQILVRNNEDLTVIVSKYKGGTLEPGELSMDLIENSDMSAVEVYVSVEGIQSYKQYAEEYLNGKTEDEKIQVVLDYTGCETKDEFLSNMGVTTMDEVYSMVGADNLDDMIIMYSMIDGYDLDENEVDVDVTGGSGINESINLAYDTYVLDIVPGNGTYKYTATSGGNSTEGEITISSVDESVDDETIFTYDTTTGYITGIKDEYISDVLPGSAQQTYVLTAGVYLTKGAPVLNIPSEIDGTTIVGIDAGAIMNIHNITKLILPDTIVEIGESAFWWNRYLKYVDFPSSVTTLGSNAFWQTGIEELYIPSTITTIGEQLILGADEKVVTINCEATEKPAGWDSDWVMPKYQPGKYIINWGINR